MANYTTSETSLQQGSPPTSYETYPPPNQNTSNAPYPPGFGTFVNQDPATQQAPTQHQQHQTPPSAVSRANAAANGEHQSRNANRLRKACDNCSIRKVKCEEVLPCRACVALEIECTNNRVSKRRGPPNKLAERRKREKLEEHHQSRSPRSPTDAAQSLARLSQPHVQPMAQPHLYPPDLTHLISMTEIIDSATLGRLMENYFLYIHPVIPMPHEPTFHNAWDDHFKDSHQSKEDRSNFVALVASMVSVLTSSFPRKVLDLLKDLPHTETTSSSMNFIQHCQRIVGRCSATSYHRTYTVNDAIVSYLQGVLYTSINMGVPAVRHFKDCLATLVSLGLQLAAPKEKRENEKHDEVDLSSPAQRAEYSTVDYEMARRVFWNCFASIKSREQLGTMPSQLCIPPSTKVEPWPHFPSEVDDLYITEQGISQQNPHTHSELIGFNINIRIFDSYRKVSDREMVTGAGVLVDWHSQKKEIVESITRVKKLVNALPTVFQLPEPQNDLAAAWHPPQIYPDSDIERSAQNASNIDVRHVEDPIDTKINIQKANIHATQLGTRCYLVDKFFLLSTLNMTRKGKDSPPSYIEERGDEKLHQEMRDEWKSIIHQLLNMVSVIQRIHMEPNGASLIAKIRSIAGTLTSTPNSYPNVPAMDNYQVYLRQLLDVLIFLEKSVTPSTHHDGPQDEDDALRAWANLAHVQHDFLRRVGKNKD